MLEQAVQWMSSRPADLAGLPAKGKLAFAGGFVDNDESAEDGLRRELREEIGIEVGALEFLASRPNTYPHGGIVYPTLDFFFVVRVTDFCAAQALDGVEGLVVLPVAEVSSDELAFTSMREVWSLFRQRRT